MSRLLLDYGAKADNVGVDELTPLHYAAADGNTEVAAILLESGTKFDAADNDS